METSLLFRIALFISLLPIIMASILGNVSEAKDDIALQAANGQYICAEGGGGDGVVANRNAVGSWETFRLINRGDNNVALQASNGKYACAESGGGNVIVANRNAIGAWEIFKLIDLGNNNVALRAYNGQYVCAEGGGGGAVVANRNAVGAWETFKRINLDNIALRASNGQYVCAEGGGGREVVANRNAKGSWETFKRMDLGNNNLALRASNGQFVCAEGGGGDGVYANRNAVGSWEMFKSSDLGNNYVALRAANGQYVCAEKGGGDGVVANRNSAGSWEKFLLNVEGITSTYGLDFSPYMDGQNPNNPLTRQISEDQIRARMRIIAPYTSWVRTFGCTYGLENAGRIAHEMGLKVAVGAWLEKNGNNQEQINNLIQVANAGQADMVIVGSEALSLGSGRSLTENELIGYIQQVRSAIPSGIPVTYAFAYGELERPNIVAVVDIVLVNIYPFYADPNGVNVDQAIDNMNWAYYQYAIPRAQGKQVLISETGWPSCGSPKGQSIASQENAAKYFKAFVKWAADNNVPYFYFEAFDESWKAAEEGARGACWGIWDKGGSLKPEFWT
ncbi:FRG1-like domain protein [uncultured archaeon]|nr:FRG1-like domain protein [uncultured archaeon]